VATARVCEFVDAACDTQPEMLPLLPQVVEVVHIANSALERPPMTPQEMAAAVAAIMISVSTASPSAVINHLCNTLGSLVAMPQRETISFSVLFTANCVNFSAGIWKRHSANWIDWTITL